MGIKKYKSQNTYEAAKERISTVFDGFQKIYVSFSAGKDSTVMLHMVADEAIKRGRRFAILLIDMEAQYKHTIQHGLDCMEKYKDIADIFWVSLPLALRNAVSNYEPKWLCWSEEAKDLWVRQKPDISIKNSDYFDFFVSGMEFEEFVPLFGEWYSEGKPTACFVGIRTDESLNRFRTIQQKNKVRFKGLSCTTLVSNNVFNVYPIYDWKTSDIWLYHYRFPEKKYNQIYDYMFKAGLTPDQMRICQPYGDDQRRGLWLYHIMEPETWYKVVARLNGVNSGSLYIQENGNITGYNKITKPDNHTWKSFCNLLLRSLPEKTRNHYLIKFKTFIGWWIKRGYYNGIPDESPLILEAKRLAPSYRRLCKVLLRNDYWCKGLCFSQPKSEAYQKYIERKKLKS